MPIEEFLPFPKILAANSGTLRLLLGDSVGFPFELTKEIASENGLKVDEEGFKKAMQEQKDRAKAATQKISLTDDLKYVAIENEFGSTNFLGYEQDSTEDAKIVATIDCEGGLVDIVLDKTPFYAECGGQVGDSGVIENENLKAEVLTTFKVNNLYVHRSKVINGEITINDKVKAYIDTKRREEIRVHHTSAHLLQAALTKVLGDEVKQAGSQVEENRMRFDFTFSRAMIPEEVQKTEDIINGWIHEKLDVHTDVMDIEQAKLTGAVALFGEKYGDTVRVVSIGEPCISKEFCAGTHARNTGDLRLIKLISEGAIAAGTRRIEAVVSDAALDYINAKIKEIDKLSTKFKVHFDEVEERIDKIMDENKNLQKEIVDLKSENARSKFNSFLSKAQDINGGKLFISKIEQMDNDSIKAGVEFLSNKLGESVIVLVSPRMVLVKVSDSFVKKGVNAGKIVGDIAKASGANGGGRPNFAQGGIKDISKIDETLLNIENELKG